MFLLLLIFPQDWDEIGPDISRPLTLVILSFGITSFFIILLGRSSILESKWKYILSFLILCSALVHLGNMFSISNHDYYFPVYVFGFFLFNTLTETIFIYTVQINEQVEEHSFDDFMARYEIFRNSILEKAIRKSLISNLWPYKRLKTIPQGFIRRPR